MNRAGQQVDAGQQGDGAVALVFVIACEGRMHAGFGRQIGCCRCDRLDEKDTNTVRNRARLASNAFLVTASPLGVNCAISFRSLKRSCYEEAMAPAQHGTSVAAVLGALFLALLLAALDQTIVSTALPTIVGELGGLSYLS